MNKIRKTKIINSIPTNDMLTKENPVSNILPTTKQIKEIARALKPIAVITYLDKNPGAGIIMCKRHHWEINKTTFQFNVRCGIVPKTRHTH